MKRPDSDGNAWATWAGRVAGLLALGIVSTLFALLITPPVAVSAFGQTVDVGAVKPGITLGLQGPGEADLFGEGTLETVQHFDGPIRPRVTWQRFNRNDDASAFIQSTSDNGTRTVTTGSAVAGQALQDGWTEYFIRLIAVSALLGGALYLLLVGVSALIAGSGHHSHPRRRHLALLASSVAVSLLVTAGFTGLTVASASQQLGQIKSLADLVGTADFAPVATAAGPERSDIDVVVIGDSTAAGIGNAPVADETDADAACRRSRDSYAMSLQTASGLRVLNLACSSATIAAGLLGPQAAGGMLLEPQVGMLKSIKSAQTVIVSIGANDVGWSDAMKFCYGLNRCDDQASNALFRNRLDTFRIQYSQLLQQLSDLPSRPDVIVNEYYDPFGDSFDCAALQDPAANEGAPEGYGFGPDPGQDNQQQKIDQKVKPLESELAQMNTVLAKGAQAFGFTAVQPSFADHELCTDQPWVQGMNDAAPFHPSAAGELAIAAADLPYLPGRAP